METKLKGGYLYQKEQIVRVLAIVDRILSTFVRTQRKSAPKNPKKILIVKPDHLGDFLLSTAALNVLRLQFPQSSIDYVVGPWNSALAKGYPQIRRLHLFRHPQVNRVDVGVKKWIAFIKDIFRVIPAIRKEKYDAIFLLRPYGGNLVFLSAFMGSAFVAGHGTAGGKSLLNASANWIQDVHEVEHFGEVLRASGVEFDPDTLFPFFSALDPVKLPPALPEKFLCLHPGAGAATKKLAPRVWQQIVDRDPQLPIVICGGPAEVGFENSLTIDATREIHNLSNRLSFAQVLAVFDQAAQLHVLDSFSAHLAGLSKCSEIYAHYLPASDPVQWRPLGPQIQMVLHPETDGLDKA